MPGSDSAALVATGWTFVCSFFAKVINSKFVPEHITITSALQTLSFAKQVLEATTEL